ncbi:hypothetical protein BH20ACT2_BH20ACT2_09290 [soil metagenome]
MRSPADLEHRLRAAAGAAPDTERALDGVMSRVWWRRRAVFALAATILIMGGLATVWGVDRQASDDSAVFVGDPSSTSGLRIRELWRAQGVSGGSAPASGGRLITTIDDLVLAAEGFGPGRAEPTGRITGLERGTGIMRWMVELGDPAFLQGAAGGTAIANTQYERIVGLDVADGTVRWEIALSELGLDGYGAVTSAVTEPLTAIGLSANAVGDVRPPVILGVDTRTGEVSWTTPLVGGTDLMWGVPSVSEGAAVFTSTLSNPGSAEENVAHLIRLADGSIGWTAGMGGSQGFSDVPAVIDPPYVHLPAHPDVLTVALADGSPHRARPGYGAVLVGEHLWTLKADGSLVMQESATGVVMGQIASPVEQPRQLLDLGEDLVGVVNRTQLAALRADGEVVFTQALPSALADLALFDRGLLLVATQDHQVAAYAIETSSTQGEGSSSPLGD